MIAGFAFGFCVGCFVGAGTALIVLALGVAVGRRERKARKRRIERQRYAAEWHCAVPGWTNGRN